MLFHRFLQSMKTILNSTAVDPSLIAAISLVPVQAATTNLSNIEALSHRGGLLTGLRSNMAKPGWMPKVSSLSAMLLLIGYEYQIDGVNSASIATHLRGLQTMLRSFQPCGDTTLLASIQRALFWQDLTNCLVAGTPRLFSHRDYKDLERFRDGDDGGERLERRDSPHGFVPYVEEWPDAFTSILEDLHALCKTIDANNGEEEHTMTAPLPISTLQANLESRVVDILYDVRLSKSSDDPIYEACAFAVYLCTYELSTGIWVGCYNPEICVNQIIRRVVGALRDMSHISHEEVLFWLLYVSGGLTLRNHTRAKVVALMKTLLRDRVEKYVKDWETTRQFLREYIWSEQAMDITLFRFWEELQHSWKGLTKTGPDEEDLKSMLLEKDTI
ncbi:hypothetical protein DE146DRAFT_305384 [Phaeosphaeria sp. MPI-PUGE-AT-0046c]|nr:hypothetical protein DE146DRAFT_305384 [Phaeosphaeria sp. MPI-PUGE-AT-0046c]